MKTKIFIILGVLLALILRIASTPSPSLFYRCSCCQLIFYYFDCFVSFVQPSNLQQLDASLATPPSTISASIPQPLESNVGGITFMVSWVMEIQPTEGIQEVVWDLVYLQSALTLAFKKCKWEESIVAFLQQTTKSAAGVKINRDI